MTPEEAMKKQTPLEMIPNKGTDEKFEMKRCPVCGTLALRWDYFQYCKRCGQLMEWRKPGGDTE